jgi:hypothetical protein
MSRWTGQERKALRVLLLLLAGGLAGQLWLRIAHETYPVDHATTSATVIEAAPIVVEMELEN